MKAYLENSCVSAWAKEETANQFECVEQLLTLWEERKIDLVTSKVTYEEIDEIDFDQIPEKHRLRFQNVPPRTRTDLAELLLSQTSKLSGKVN